MTRKQAHAAYVRRAINRALGNRAGVDRAEDGSRAFTGNPALRSKGSEAPEPELHGHRASIRSEGAYRR